MKISVNAKLIQLAKLFRKNGSRLYIVGGYVRNALLGLQSDDIDLAGSLGLDKVLEALKNTDFGFIIKDKQLGTADIVCDGSAWEYTTFRKEVYKNDGSHRPDSVEFIKTPEEDASRRDFTCNAIYYDILKDEVLDFYNGVTDIKKKLLKTVLEPEDVFENDGLRILRMLRLSSELKFAIDYKTQYGAEQKISKLHGISGQRKLKEIEYILGSNARYPHIKSTTFLKTLQKFNSMKLWKSLFLPIEKIRINVVRKVELQDRFLGLVIDMVMSARPHDKDAFIINLLGNDGFGLPTQSVIEDKFVILGFFDAMSKLNNKDYFFKYFVYFPRIAKILKCCNKKIYKKYKFFYNYLINNKIAIQTKDLAIKASDIKSNFEKIPAKRYSFILNELLSKVFEGSVNNSRESLLKEVENYDY